MVPVSWWESYLEGGWLWLAYTYGLTGAFTVEYDAQLYFRRAKQLQISWWDKAYLEERIASAVLDRPGA